MNCPHCPQSTLAISERQGIEIDYCPSCRGIWLDRGELDKLLEFAAHPNRSASQPAPSHRDFADSDYPVGHGNQGHSGARLRRRKSWLDDFFD